MRRLIKRSALPVLMSAMLMFGEPARAAGRDPMIHLQENLSSALACENSRAQVFELFFDSLARQETLSESLQSNFESKSPALFRAMQTIHQLLHSDVSRFARLIPEESERDPYLHLIRLEMRSQIEPEYELINRELDEALTEARISAERNHLSCVRSARAESDLLGFGRSLESRAGEISYAARRTMATAYQSCRVLELPPVTNKVKDVEGAERSVPIDSVGWGRKYTDLSLLKQTHYYHRVTKFSGKCLNQDKQPLVYDYGGAPGVNAANGTLNLFVNNGGGPALGIDCSAFVSMAAVSAGSLFRKGAPNRAIYTRFVSRDFIDAKKSGWSCFENVRVNRNASILPGDIAAYRGHVVIVESVGQDPFGLGAIRDRSQCASLTSRNFDFVFIQSSPSQEHLGINRYLAKEYLAEGGLMTDLFMRHAKQACLSKFDGLERTPSTEKYGIVRHRKTSQCLAPRIKVGHEDCVANCANL